MYLINLHHQAQAYYIHFLMSWPVYINMALSNAAAWLELQPWRFEQDIFPTRLPCGHPYTIILPLIWAWLKFSIYICTRSWKWNLSHMLSTGLPWEVTEYTHHHPHKLNKLATKGGKWNGKLRLVCVNLQHPPLKTPVDVLLWIYQSQGKWPSRQTDGQSNHQKWLVSQVLSVEELEMISAGTRPRTLHHGSPGGKRHGKRKPLNKLPSKGKKGPLSIKQTWSDRAHMGLPEHVGKYHPELNWAWLRSSMCASRPKTSSVWETLLQFEPCRIQWSTCYKKNFFFFIHAGIKQKENM